MLDASLPLDAIKLQLMELIKPQSESRAPRKAREFSLHLVNDALGEQGWREGR